MMFCMDDVDKNGKFINKKLFGTYEYGPHRHIEIIFKPCVPRSRAFSNETACIMDNYQNETALEKRLSDTKKWLQDPELILVYNEQTPALQHFDEQEINFHAKVLSY